MVFEVGKSGASGAVGLGEAGIDLDGVVEGGQSFSVAFEFKEDMTSDVVSLREIGVELEGVVIGPQGFFVVVGIIESSPFVETLPFGFLSGATSWNR